MMFSDLIGMPSRPCFRLVDHLVKDVNGVLVNVSHLKEEKQDEGNVVHGGSFEKVDFSRKLSGVLGDHIAILPSNLTNDFDKFWEHEMGGWGSGRRRSSKATTLDYLELDVRRLQRDGLLEVRRSFNWRWTRNGEPVADINIIPENDRVVLIYRTQQSDQERTEQNYPVLLERTPCNYGGERVWFRCPVAGCGRRAAILYGEKIFACRFCRHLAYPCQNASSERRAISRANVFRERLGDRGSIFDPFPLRPKGMHLRTYYGLGWRYENAALKALKRVGCKLGMTFEDATENGKPSQV
jgi:hypothetical protein